MGTRGPAPRPTSLRVLRGDHPERINRNEPQPARLPVIKPEWLSPVASAKWDELAPHLEALGVLKAVDVDMLIAYCECWARYKRICQLAAKAPPVFPRSPPGTPPEQQVFVKNPMWSQVRDTEAELRVLAREFGFTPSARTGLRVEVVPSGVGRLLTGG